MGYFLGDRFLLFFPKYSCSFARFFSTVLRHTNVYLLAFDSIFVPSIYSTTSVMKPRSASRSTTCVKMLLTSFFTRHYGSGWWSRNRGAPGLPARYNVCRAEPDRGIVSWNRASQGSILCFSIYYKTKRLRQFWHSLFESLKKVIPLGFEPKTHALEGRCSNPTELRNHFLYKCTAKLLNYFYAAKRSC